MWRCLTSSVGSTGTSRDSRCLTRSSWPPSAAQCSNVRPFCGDKARYNLKKKKGMPPRGRNGYERCPSASSAFHSRSAGSSRPRFCRGTPDRAASPAATSSRLRGERGSLRRRGFGRDARRCSEIFVSTARKSLHVTPSPISTRHDCLLISSRA